jgi:Uma2 family endonuclease
VQLHDRPYEVFTSDLRVRVSATGLGTYPDASVVCEALAIDTEDPKRHTITNPKVLVEVTSPSTEEYDRGDKREQYQTITSLEELVIVSQETRQVSIWRREGDGWSEQTVTGSAVAELTSIGCRLSLDEIYRDPLAPPV